jgi:hypothetical protein
MKRTSSLVWEKSHTGDPYFVKIPINGNIQLGCNLCGKDAAGEYKKTFTFTNGSTSSARNHLISEHRIISDRKKPTVQLNTLDHFATPTIDCKSPLWGRFLQAYCYWVVEDMIPLNKLTKPGFKAMLRVLGVKSAPQPKQVKALLKSYQASIKDILREEFASLGTQVSLTADSWTSKRQEGFFTLTCHYITENWV